MKVREVARQRQRLDALFASAREFEPESESLAHWGRYLCIRVCGFMEVAIREYYVAYAAAANVSLGRFAHRHLGRLTNVKASKLVQVATSFKPEWGEALQRFLEVDGRKEAIDGLVNNRNQIAHGQDAGITVARCKGYYAKALEVLKFIEGQLDL